MRENKSGRAVAAIALAFFAVVRVVAIVCVLAFVWQHGMDRLDLVSFSQLLSAVHRCFRALPRHDLLPTERPADRPTARPALDFVVVVVVVIPGWLS